MSRACATTSSARQAHRPARKSAGPAQRARLATCLAQTRSGSSMILKFLRLLKILRVSTKYGLDEIAISGLKCPAHRQPDRHRDFLARPVRRRAACACAMALEELGPIFVKFGQVLSTRRDLMPPDIADELARAAGPGAAVRFRPGHRADHAVARRPPGPAVCPLRARAGGLGLDRPGALRHAARTARKWPSRCCVRA